MAQILPFPQDRNVGKARRVARVWLSFRGRQREAYWSNTVGRLAFVLERIGFDEAEVDRQLEAFKLAVQAQIDIPTDDTIDNRNPPPGAA